MKTRISKILIALVVGLAGTSALATEPADEGAAASQALQKSMDPNVWIKLMNSMMSGELQGQPLISSCVECHDDVCHCRKNCSETVLSIQPRHYEFDRPLDGAVDGRREE